ncbi:PREDICTED: uroplakin-3a isoform X1 [Hipposideros armiger]|uniref:Uroplakin-3a isoform X1 n=1 Tax=Hipposideros armiger TaxID=186990 RepID=A0A8B7S3M7_HIPAR|nr:PREDICTED: uroplakin-3a isoform X1 [Hipposideros armiger]
MPPLWALLALGCLRLCSGVNLQPQMASVTFATNNPTLSTVALEKPLCMFDSTVALSGPYQVYLYVLVDSASSRNASVQDDTQTPLSSTFQQTDGGRTGPYKASAFDLAPCSDLPSLAAVGDVSRASEILNAYLIRVGTNVACLSDPNFQSVCNPPLSAATEYRISPTSLWPELTGWVEVILTPSPSRFKYVLVNMSTGLVQDQTLWSDPIRTNRLTPYSVIDTWPGRRSGGMIVVTSILGSLPFFLLLGFVGAIVLSLIDMGGSDGETTHDSQITQEAVSKSLGTSESSYTSVNRGLPLDRAEVYASKLQD